MRIYAEALLDGGGETFGSMILETVADLNLTPGRAFEVCSGYGAIGYRLLERDLCDHLVLGDINPKALELARRTASSNGLENVTIYETDCLDGIPNSERWDLVIGNPPHFDEPFEIVAPRIGHFWPIGSFHQRIWRDPNWSIHARFFAGISQYLAEDGVIVLCETWDGSKPETFATMIADAGLRYEVVPGDERYYMIVARRI